MNSSQPQVWKRLGTTNGDFLFFIQPLVGTQFKRITTYRYLNRAILATLKIYQFVSILSIRRLPSRCRILKSDTSGRCWMWWTDFSKPFSVAISVFFREQLAETEPVVRRNETSSASRFSNTGRQIGSERRGNVGRSLTGLQCRQR